MPPEISTGIPFRIASVIFGFHSRTVFGMSVLFFFSVNPPEVPVWKS